MVPKMPTTECVKQNSVGQCEWGAGEQEVAEPERSVSCLLPAALLLDWLERLIVLGLYSWFVARIIGHFWETGNLGNVPLLLSEGLVVLFILIRRRAREISRRPVEWLIALLATISVFLVTPGSAFQLIPMEVGAVAMLMGIIVQLHAKLVLGRSFGCVPAHRGLKTAGPYRLVRHPMYAGYLLCHLAFLALNPSLLNLLIYSVCYSLQIPRLLAEERLLSTDPHYREYQATVRYRLIPGLF